jgi:hypothetical protein
MGSWPCKADSPDNTRAVHEFNRVMIYLDAGDLDVNYEDGRVDHQHRKVNDVAWSPAGGRHISENVVAKDLRIVEVELKKAAPASKIWTAAPPPPTEKPAPCAALAVTLSGAKGPLRTGDECGKSDYDMVVVEMK